MSAHILKIGGGLAVVVLSWGLLQSAIAQPRSASDLELPAPPAGEIGDSTPPVPPPPPGAGIMGVNTPISGELPPDPVEDLPEAAEDILKYRISYICTVQDAKATDQTNLCVVNSDGTHPRILIQGGLIDAVVWSLDGRGIYFSYDKGAANLAVPGLADVSIPHNFDVHYLNWESGAYSQLTSSNAPERPLQDLPNFDQLLVSRGQFINETSQLGSAKKKLEIKLKLVDFPCVFSTSEQNCEIFGSGKAQDIAQADCPPLPLPLPLGISPFGGWATQSALFCEGADRVTGFYLVNNESGEKTKILHKDLGACQVIDFNGGVAVNDDGSPVLIPFNTQQLKTGECRFYLSPERQRMAYINASGQVGVIDLNTRQLEYLTVEARVTGVNGLAWSPDGNHLLGYERTVGGPMYRVSALAADDVSFLGYGSQPTWSPIPLSDYTAEVAAAPPETTGLEGINKSQSASQAAAGCTLIR